MGVVVAKAGPLKIHIVNYGPVLSEGNEKLTEILVNEFLKSARSKGAFLAQLAFPAQADQENPPSKHLLCSSQWESHFPNSKKGLIFKYVTGLSAFRSVNLFPGSSDTYEKVRANYKSATRRDVNKAQRMGNELYFPTSAAEIKEAYELIELNAENQGYSVRSWQDFGPTLIAMIENGQCLFVCCKNEMTLKGGLIIFDVGQKLHYIMGATLREKKDLMVGHFLQDQVIRIGIEKGYDFYDISMGGSPGVVKFKEGFGGEVIGLIEPTYWVLKPLQFAAFEKLMPWVQKNKSKVAKLLSKLS